MNQKIIRTKLSIVMVETLVDITINECMGFSNSKILRDSDPRNHTMRITKVGGNSIICYFNNVDDMTTELDNIQEFLVDETQKVYVIKNEVLL